VSTPDGIVAEDAAEGSAEDVPDADVEDVPDVDVEDVPDVDVEDVPDVDVEDVPDVDVEDVPDADVEDVPDVDAEGSGVSEGQSHELLNPVSASIRDEERAGFGDLSAHPNSPYTDRGDIEIREILRAMEEFELEPDHDPYRKAVCEIRQRAYRIVHPDDWLPTWLNGIHRVTRERVISRANTMLPGDEFSVQAYEDAERAIRNPFVFSVVAVVPTRSDIEGCVDLLIITRDVWSLKVTGYVESNGRTITELHVGGSESNVLGTTDTLAFGATRTLSSWSIGPAYLSRHLAGSRVTFYEDFDFVLDREVGGLEGTRNTLQLARPLYASHVRWGWAATVQHDFSIVRRYVGDQLSLRQVGAYVVEERYRSRFAGGSIAVTRSWGSRFKHNLTPGFQATWRDVEPISYDPEIPANVLRVYERIGLPRSEVAVGATLGYRFFRNEYFRLVNYATYGVGEEIREGHFVGMSVFASEPTFGATTRFLRQTGTLAYRLQIGDDAFISASVDNSMRYAGAIEDFSLTTGVRIVTPAVMAGRIVARVSRTDLLQNEGNALLTAGGGPLRGYPTNAFQGDHVVAGNLEWRSSPIRILSARIGMVTFVDTAGVWSDDEPPVFHGSAGLGLRLVLPALSTTVRAADLSFPFERTSARYAPVFSIGLDQTF
jgi:hypothetical protein